MNNIIYVTPLHKIFNQCYYLCVFLTKYVPLFISQYMYVPVYVIVSVKDLISKIFYNFKSIARNKYEIVCTTIVHNVHYKLEILFEFYSLWIFNDGYSIFIF